MTWYPDRIPDGLSRFFKRYFWHGDREVKTVYLTFDDGPTPLVTDFVLNELAVHRYKATFFLIGNSVKRQPELKNKVLQQGHQIGNHTYHHLNNWKHSTAAYISDVKLAEEVIDSKLFRPPYGRIKKSSARKLRALGYQIILWDTLSGDFDRKRSAKSCLNGLKKNTKNGSVIVFHDSEKAFPILHEILPPYLQWLKEKGYSGAVC